MALIIKQGDQYKLPVGLSLDGVDITEGTLYAVDTVEFYLADNLLEYRADSTGQVTFDGGDFLLPLTQAMTFALRSAPVPLDIRVKFADGDVCGLEEPLKVTVAEARSRREL